jgi:hypothetical protein
MAAPLQEEQELLSTAPSSGVLLDELYSTLLRARSDDAVSSKQKAISIIAELPPEDVYGFMQQLLDTAASGPRLRLHCSDPHAELSHSNEVPDSPQRLAPVVDQQFSPVLDSSKARGSKELHRDDEDVQQLPDSPLLHLQLDPNPVQLQQLPQQHSGSGRCFVAESLDLNLGASYDWLSKASLADFSSAAAAARLSTTNLAAVRQSHMRMLSPVEEASFLSVPADTQQDTILEDSASLLESPATMQQGHYSEPGTWQLRQEAAHSSSTQYTPGLGLPDTAETDMGLSTCSSPRDAAEPAAAGSSWVGPAAATAMRVSVAESAHGWPNSQPLPIEVQDLAEEEPAEHWPAHMQQAAAGQDITAASCYTVAQGTATPAVHVQPQYFARVHDAASAPVASTAAQGGASDRSSSSSTGAAAAKRGGGPNPLGLIKAPLHGANALRRSIGRLWGGKGAGQKPKEPAPASPPSSSSSKQPARSLACASAPMAAVYGRPSKLPSVRQTPSPAVQPPMRGFSVTQKGSSPTKAAAAAVAAAVGSAKKQSAAAAARPGSSTPSQRPGSSISYRPPSAAAAPGPAAGDVGAPMGKADAAFVTPSRAAATSRIPVQSPGVSGTSSGSGRTGGATPTSRMQQQQQRGAHGAAHDRPSSQASVSSYARSDATFTATGSHTSGGPFQGGFQATHKALGEKKTPTLKQPASRLQQRQQQQQLAQGAAAQAGSSRIGRGPVAPTGAFSQQSTHSAATQQVGYPPSRLPAAATAAHGSQFGHHGSAFGGRSQLPAAPRAAPHSRGRGSSKPDGRSQLRRSRSCGSLAEIFDVAELRSMWHQREQQAVSTQQPAAAHRVHVAGQEARSRTQQHSGWSAGGAAQPAGARQAQQSSIGRGFGHQQAPASAAAGDVYGAEPGLPMLSRCQSPTRSAEHDREQQLGASMVLARMGNVIGHVDALLAGDAATGAPAGPAQGGAEQSNLQQRQLGGQWPVAATEAASASHGPSPLVYKLVKGAQGVAAGSAAAAAAATPDRHALHSAGGGVGLGRQQMLMTPPAHLPGVPGLGGVTSRVPGSLQESTGSVGGGWGPGGGDKWVAEGSLEASPAVSPDLSVRSRQVSCRGCDTRSLSETRDSQHGSTCTSCRHDPAAASAWVSF